MNHEEVYAPAEPLSRQNIYIVVSTKLRFQRTLRSMIGSRRLAAINASLDPFFLPMIRQGSTRLDVIIFVLL